MSEIRILLVTHYYADHLGGVEIAAHELASRLAVNNCHVVWAASGPAPALPAGIEALPMRAWNVAERRFGFPYPVWGPRSTARLWREVRQADVVHLHDSLYFGNAASYGAAKWLRKPVIVTQYIGAVPYQSRFLRVVLETANRTLARAVLGGSDQAVFTADRVRAYFTNFVTFRRPPVYWPTAVDLERFCPVDDAARRRLRQDLGLSEGRPAILFVGRFVEKKGLHFLRSLATRFAGCDWLFAGWGQLDPSAWNLSNVRVAGRLDHDRLRSYYRAADLMLLPSVGEGFPLVVQEAMACGTPALITCETALGSPGIEQVVWLSEPRIDELSRALGDILASPAGLKSRRDQVAEFAHTHWSWEQCTADYLDLLRAHAIGTAERARMRSPRLPIAETIPKNRPMFDADAPEVNALDTHRLGRRRRLLRGLRA